MTTSACLLALLLQAQPTGPATLPLVPAGPSAGDMAEGWAAGFETVAPSPGAHVPWLKSATAARLFLHRLPAEPELARPRIVEACAMILARHGRVFEHPHWDDWFRRHDWYRPRADYSPGLLSRGEREALDRLIQAWHDRS